ncbi:MAG: tyrosine-type recombinase/integrase [Desulfoferrobacter sp.]
MVGRYLEEQAKERSRNASNKDRKNLLAMFNWAAKRLDTRHNPAVMIDRLSHDRQPRYVPPEKDVLKVLATTTREEQVLLDCYLYTGARRMEIFRLTWQDDVNLEKCQIRLGTRKTKDGSISYEWLPMNKSLHDSLMWLYRNRKFPDSPFVFVCDQPGTRYGQPYTTRRKFMAGLCKRAGVRPFGFHALRDFVASILADKHKASTKTIQRVLRHKSVHTTERYLQNMHTDLGGDDGTFGL